MVKVVNGTTVTQETVDIPETRNQHKHRHRGVKNKCAQQFEKVYKQKH